LARFSLLQETMAIPNFPFNPWKDEAHEELFTQCVCRSNPNSPFSLSPPPGGGGTPPPHNMTSHHGIRAGPYGMSQITDDILEALADIQQLRMVGVGYSCKCTVSGVLALTRLKSLETLQVGSLTPPPFPLPPQVAPGRVPLDLNLAICLGTSLYCA